MPQLFLHGLHISLYDNTTINLYVAYKNEKNEMVDYQGELITESNQAAFARHLKSIVISAINKQFKNNYYISGIDNVDNVPFPTLLAMRNDKRQFTQNDVDVLRVLVEAALLDINMSTRQSPRLFTVQPIDNGKEKDHQEAAMSPRKTRSQGKR